MSGWTGVDLDGTLARYDGWLGPEHIGEPIAIMVTRVRRWLEEGREVRIFTARVSQPDPAENARIAGIIQTWLERHGLPRLKVTCVKDVEMVEIWDDRAVQVIPNTGRPVR